MQRQKSSGWLRWSCALAAVVVSSCSSNAPEQAGVQEQELVQPPPNGTVSTIAGTGSPGAADNANATLGTFNDPAAVAAASNGDLFVADWMNNSVRRLSAGALTTVAKGSPNVLVNPRAEGSGAGPVPGWTVAAGTWSVASRTNACVDPCPTPFDGSKWISGMRGAAAEAAISQTIDLTAYRTAIAAGRIQGAFSAAYRGGSGAVGPRVLVEYLDSGNVVRTSFSSGLLPLSAVWQKVSDQRAVSTLATKVRVTLYTTFQSETAFDGLQLRMVDTTAGANDRLLSGPSAVAIASNGELWVGANGLWHGSTNGATFVKVADAAPYVAPRSVSAIAALSNGYIYIAEPTSAMLHVRGPSGGGYYANLALAAGEQIVAVAGEATATNNKVWVATRSSNQVGYYTCPLADTAGTTVTCGGRLGTVGGTRGFLDDMDGTAGGEKLGFINALAIGTTGGDLFISEESNHAIRRSRLPLTQTSAGTGTAGFVEGVSTSARFNSPGGLAVAPNGNVVVADRMNNRVRSISCAGINVCGGPVAGCTMLTTDDQNACTTDACLVLGVRHDPVANGTGCNDNNGCTINDACSSGTCGGAPKPVTDNDECTTDSCAPATGIVTHTPLAAINDSNACTADSCDPVTGGVQHTTISPNDNNACTTDSCDTTTGIHNVPIAVPSDGNPCTLDWCDPATGAISHPPAPEGTGCGTNQLCGPSGQCEAAVPPVQSPSPGTVTGTPIGEATSFIYSGNDKVQNGVPAGYIDTTHAGWLVGYVKTAAGNPIANVTVSIAGNTNYGSTLTRTDGRFDLVVNGGQSHTVRFAKAQHLTVDRKVYVGWQETAAVGNVVMLTLDGNSTTVTSGLQTQQVVVGTTETEGGTRTAMLVLPKNTGVFVDGSTTAKTSVTLRVTEYTRGTDGMSSMPAPVAERTAYTYAAEISADEALSANQVDFKDSTSKQPKNAYFYVDNFLNFPVGKAIPAGYYDRQLLTWVPSASGKIIRILSVTGAVADVDVAGNGQVADATTLTANGFTTEELTLLKTRYAKDKQLWRVPITHMTPWDCNAGTVAPPCEGSVCPSSPTPPPPEPPNPCDGVKTGSIKLGSIIGCDSQSLGEETPVAGTDFKLRYASSRLPGALFRQIRIPITGAQVHSQTASVEATVAIAGQVISKVYKPVPPATAVAPNLSWDFVWDDQDGFGRAVVGVAQARVTVKTLFTGAPYVMVSTFADYPSPTDARVNTFPGDGRGTFLATSTWTTPIIGRLPDSGWMLGGWTLNEHHYFDPVHATLYLGSGNKRSLRGTLDTFHRVMGDGTSNAFATDDSSATASGTGLVSQYNPTVVAPNGDIFVADQRNVIRRIDAKTRTIKTVVGDVNAGGNACPALHSLDDVKDGDDALQARLFAPGGIAIGEDGSLFITSWNRVRKATPKATGGYKIETFAGSDCNPGFSGDGGLATAARLNYPTYVAVGPDHSVYISELNRVRRIGPDNIIQTVAGTGANVLPGSMEGNNQPAKDVPVSVSGLAVTADGEIYMNGAFPSLTVGNGGYIAKIDRSGVLRYLTTGDCRAHPFTEGVLLANSCEQPHNYIAVRPDGSFVFASTAPNLRTVLREVDPTGIVTTLSGGLLSDFTIAGDGLAAADGPTPNGSVSLSPDGGVLLNDQRALYMVGHPDAVSTQFCGSTSYAVPNGDELYCFDRTGRHQKTVDRRNGQSRLTFLYDASGMLTTITDRFNRSTTVKKLASPSRYEITAPYGQKTTIGLDAGSGYATSISDALAGIQLTPLSDGFLDKMTDRSGNDFDFTFTNGLLTSDISSFGEQTLARTSLSRGRLITYKSPLQRQTTFQTIVDDAGTISQTTTYPNLSTELRTTTPAGVDTVTDPDGTVTTTQLALDPSVNPPQMGGGTKSIKLPSGLTLTTMDSRGAPTAITGGMSQVSKVIYGSSDTSPAAVTTQTYTTDGTNLPDVAAARKIVMESPEGIKRTTLLNAFGKPIQIGVGSLTPVKLTYDSTSTSADYGKLKSVSRGDVRTLSIAYQPKGAGTPPADAGYILRVTTLAGATKFQSDVLGRVVSQLEGEGSDVAGTTGFGFDGNGSLNLVKPPSTKATPPQHAFGYQINFPTSYTPPSITGIFDPKTTYTPDADRALTKETGPKALSTSTPVSVTYTYVAGSDELDTVGFPANGTLYPLGKVDYDYFPDALNGGARGRPSDIKGPYAVNLKYEYDGSLTTKTTWTGDVSGSVSWSYNSNFLTKQETISTPTTGSAIYSFAYDNDGVIKCASSAASNPCSPSAAGDLLIARSTDHGMVTSVTIGAPAVGAPPVAPPPVVERFDYSDTVGDDGGPDTDGPDHAYGELRQQTLTRDTTTLAKIVYDAATERRDDLGRIKYKTETFAGSTTDIEYGYDERGRLEFVQTGAVTENFVYGPNGNRTSYTNSNGVSLTGVYDDQDRLTTYGTAAGTAVGDKSFTYTANGELSTRTDKTAGAPDVWTYGYDPLSNLVTVARSSTSTTYTYLVDGLGRRVGRRKKVGAAAEQVEKRWLYGKGSSPIAELSAAGAVTRFVYGSRRNVPDLVIKDGKVYRLFTDQVGSPRLAVNVADATDIPYRVNYSAFGEAIWAGGSATIDWIPFGFAGGLYDPDTRLVRFGARDYDPQLGRWLSKDPTLFGGGHANLYAYCGFDPINHVDPSGYVVGVDDLVFIAAGGAALAIAAIWGIAVGQPDAVKQLAKAAEDEIKKVSDRVKDICEPKSPGPEDWKCEAEKELADTGAGRMCQYTCNNGIELRPIFRPPQQQGPSSRSPLCPSNEYIEKLLREGIL